jgi:hypothetical protein
MSAFNFYLLTFFLKYFPGNIFVNSAFFAVSDFFGYACGGFIVKFSGVKKGLFLVLTISSIGGFSYLSFSKNVELVPFLICICRFGVTMTFNIGYVSIKELFPIRFNATVLGQVNLYGHIVACISPLVAETPYPFPFIVYLIAVAVSAVAVSFFEEVKENDAEIECGVS